MTDARVRRYVLQLWRDLQEAVARTAITNVQGETAAQDHVEDVLNMIEADRRRQESSRQLSLHLSRASSPLPALILNPPANSQDHRLASWRATALSTR